MVVVVVVVAIVVDAGDACDVSLNFRFFDLELFIGVVVIESLVLGNTVFGFVGALRWERY